MANKLKPKRNEKETRFINVVEFREVENQEADKMVVEGYALKFRNETLIGSKDYGYIEEIESTALNETDMRKVPLKYNHDGGYLALASTKNNSMRLSVDGIGLRFEADLLDIGAHKDVYEMVRSGLLSECSFAFTVAAEDGSDWDFDRDVPKRTIKKIERLFDVALVDIPAYDNTEVYARSFEALEDVRETVEAESRKKEVLKNSMLIKIKLENMEE
jgi:HK97 family phage prohead protease